MNRREFVVGSAAGFLGLSALKAEEIDQSKHCISIFLSGGPTQVETFDPKPLAPSNIRSVTGGLIDSSGFGVGGTFPKLFEQRDKTSIVRSFSHTNSSHGSATHWMMTGTDGKGEENQHEPSYGSRISSVFGPNSPNGMPNYVRVRPQQFDKASWLGANFEPYDAKGPGIANLTPSVDKERFDIRYKGLLAQLDRATYHSYIDDIRDQAYQIVQGNIAEAFDVTKESEKDILRYGKGLGEQLLLTKRLVERGVKFISLGYGGWDNHSNIQKAIESNSLPLDIGLACLLQDLSDIGKLKDTLIVITGEFGRTYKINNNGGRDHMPSLTPLMLAGGNYIGGRVIGESLADASAPKTEPFGPKDLLYTVCNHFGVQEVSKTDNSGRPRYIAGEGRVII